MKANASLAVMGLPLFSEKMRIVAQFTRGKANVSSTLNISLVGKMMVLSVS